ncbi:MAG: hypothetical protein J2P53_07280 [Bradyrhizobiaceae bacterium]|nr:hypothetical protein [Bradyrhizobiaceae bacterium]
MIRQLLIGLALAATPFAVYALFVSATRGGPAAGSEWSAVVVRWLTIAALVLVIAGFAVWGQRGGAPPGATYVPAHMENGRFVPGTFQ